MCLVELDIKGILKDKPVGQLVIPRMSLDLDGRYHEEWYSLHASSDGDIEEKTKAHELTQVKLTVPQNCAKCHSLLMMAQAMKCTPCGQVYCMKCSASAPSNCGILGLIRIKYLYIEEFLLPLTFYSKLMMNLLEEGFRMLQLLGRVTDEREELAKLCVTITENANLAVISHLSSSAILNLRPNSWRLLHGKKLEVLLIQIRYSEQTVWEVKLLTNT